MRRQLMTGVAVAALLAMAAGPALADPKQGGTLTESFKDDVSTLDPAIGYDWKTGR